jgi:hypothetical protein
MAQQQLELLTRLSKGADLTFATNIVRELER